MSAPFKIYNASAGSGKTYTLVKDYLKILLAAKEKEAFRYILAVTFTNKAVAEMKERIIKNLKEFASETIIEQPTDMFEAICNDLKWHPAQLQQKASQVLKSILHNYAFFDVATIDEFTHRVIRTFAFDLKLPLNFEVELDTDALLNEAVDNLISKAGEDSLISKVLIDFALEKTDDDKSWDIGFDLNKIAKHLTKENDRNHLLQLKDKTLEDYNALKELLKKRIATTEEALVAVAETVLNVITSCGLEYNDFTRSTLPNHFKKIVAKNFDERGLYGNKLQENLEDGKLYNKSLEASKASTIDEIIPQLTEAYHSCKKQYYQLHFYKNFYKNCTPLSVLNAIQNELEIIKEEQRLLLISEFNTIISEAIKDEPTPFIYERLGEKYRHYFIDEFQDTSEMQWENFIPLISNKVQTEYVDGTPGTLTLVGDAKQSIYRWRGGKAEQFIDLYRADGENPFFVAKETISLPVNYRSCDEIINFNNAFFGHVSEVFQNETYRDLYKNHSAQKTSGKKGGYVELSFIDAKTKDEEVEQIPEKVVQIIKQLTQKGYSYSDICVLTRKKWQGIAVGDVLTSLEEPIPIISSETLLLKHAPEINFINAIITLAIQPQNNERKIEVLQYLATHKLNITEKHNFFATNIALPVETLFENISDFKFSEFLQMPLYDAIEYIIRSFNLAETSNAYIQFYLDFVLEYTQKKQIGFSGFLEHWEKKKDNLSIVASDAEDAVQIMTIHKAKGLEFPVVIFPFGNLDLYQEIEPKVWYPIAKENHLDFGESFLSYNTALQNYSELGNQLYEERRAKLELDNINLLYVTFTRAVEQLYIITKKELDRSGNEKLASYSGWYINYLKKIGIWNDAQELYIFGEKTAEIFQKDSHLAKNIRQSKCISTAKESHNINIIAKHGLLWDTNQEQAIEKGNLMHDILAQIKYESDIDFVLDDYLSRGSIDAAQKKVLTEAIQRIVSHPELEKYFSNSVTILNEKDIITKTGTIIRPDRIVLEAGKKATIIDYKTGMHASVNEQQIYEYGEVLKEMGFAIQKLILVYINQEIQIKYIQ